MLSTRIELAGTLILEAVLTANHALTLGCNAVAAIPFFTKWRSLIGRAVRFYALDLSFRGFCVKCQLSQQAKVKLCVPRHWNGH